MKVAILCSGYLRSFKTTIVQLKACLLDHFDCDLYVYAISNEYESDHYVNGKDRHESLMANLQPKVYMFEKAQPDESVEQRIKQMWFKIHILYNLCQQVSQRDGFQYDRIVRIRPDLFLDMDCKQLVLQAKNSITLPSCFDTSYPTLQLDTMPGLNDQFAIGPPHYMKTYCSVYESIVSNRFENVVNSSSLLLCQLQDIPVEEVDIKYKLLLKENIVITVAGDSAAGKTTFCKLLQEQFRKHSPKMDVMVFECDRYHRWERGHEEWKHKTHLDPEANDLDKMKDDILHLKANLQISQVDYDHHKGTFTEKEIIQPTNVVLVSGLHCLYDATLLRLSDMKIYMNPEEQTKVEWKVNRDQKERGYSRDQVLKAISVREKDRELFIRPQKEAADIILRVREDGYDVTSRWNSDVVWMNMESVFQHIVSHL